MASTITVEILTIKLVSETDVFARSYYSPNTEHYVYHAVILAKDVTDPRKLYSFKADNLKMRVSSAGPVAVVSFDNEGDFVTKPEGYVISSGVEAKGSAPSLKYSTGDTITIRATEKNGKLTRVKIAK